MKEPTSNKKTRIERAKEEENNALTQYQQTMKILKHVHPEVEGMRFEYLKAKRSRLYEEGRKAKPGTKERKTIDGQLKGIEAEMEKMQQKMKE